MPENSVWPPLPFDAWEDTCATLHLWTQVVGKVRLVLSPMINHWWQVPLYVDCRGLTTSSIPYGAAAFRIDIDFIDHRLAILTSDGRHDGFPLRPCSVADFHRELMGHLRGLGIDVRIRTMPAEIPDAIPFEADQQHASYDAGSAHRFWRTLLQADRVLAAFRGRFLGKASPVHFFWGSFDLAASRFSGRRAPPHPGGVPNFPDWAVREAYSHEVYSGGFWPGNGGFGQPAFYAYAYPEPPGFAGAAIAPKAARYDETLKEFVLPYEDIRTADAPERDLLDFLQSTYEAAANLGNWDRAALERIDWQQPRKSFH